ncbi:DUF456 domain-containing protein [Roseivirga sp.]|uniref:DUF456 domain-containing protein n=1 Tax=Roseivirga sp. TaxID=1964215 RepID=UPI002B279D7F|nr:DUF456 domain-containing protein [Roseivirga sp.]
MKLYVINPNNNQKVYLNLSAPTRQSLTKQIGGENFYLANQLFSIYDVWAENDSNSTATGAVVGGFVGALGGPVGILVGGFLGGLIGKGTDEEESAKIKKFNNS